MLAAVTGEPMCEKFGIILGGDNRVEFRVEDFIHKTVENLYRPKRAMEVATAAESMVRYARSIENREGQDWKSSPMLKSIRDYNEDDCKSTAELAKWLKTIASKLGSDLQVRLQVSPRPSRKYCFRG